MQYGMTNSVVLQGGGETGGDIIYAKNQTGGVISDGTKVWCNKHTLADDTEVTPNKIEPSRSSNIMFAWWFSNIGFVHVGDLYKQVTFNYSNNSWNILDLGTYTYNNVGTPMQMNGLVWYHKIYFGYRFSKHGEVLTLPGVLLSDKYIISKDSPYYLGKYDKDNNTISQTSTLAINLGSKYRAFADNDIILVYCISNGSYTFYNVTDFDNITTIKTGSADIFKKYCAYATGLKPGDYIIQNSEAGHMNQANLLIYKIKSDYTLEFAEDLPAELQALQQQPTNVLYNNETQVLSVGTLDNLRFYKFNGEKFIPLNIQIDTLPEISKANFMYYGYLSPDMTTVCIYGLRTSGSSSYMSSNFYRLKVSDNSWYAEPYSLSTEQSAVGYATGNVDSNGKFEVRTVLPEKVTYTLNVTPIPDEIIFTGGADD